MADLPSDPAFASAAELGRAYQSGFTPLELVERQLERIERCDPHLRAFTTVRADAARADARALGDELRAGHVRSPLHGITVAFKDQMDVAGLPLTGGSRVLPGDVAKSDATVVGRLREAGAIVLGMLNTHEFHAGPTRVFPFGTPRNPWHLSHAPGGSSSGSASAVAAGLVTLSLGGDTGGSIRGPASMCGIVGLKPTWSRLSRAGIIPLAPSMDVVGPMARRVSDVAAAFAIMAGPDPRDPTASARPLGAVWSEPPQRLHGLTIGVIDEFTDPHTLEPDAIDAADAAIRTLERLGARVTRMSIPTLVHAQELMWVLVMAEAIGTHRPWLRTRLDAYDANTRTRLLAGAVMPAGLVAAANRMRARLAHDLRAALASVDLLASATGASAPALDGAPLPTVPGGQRPAAATYQPFNLSGHPAITVPCGTNRAGLPLGLQLAGPHFGEATLFDVAGAYERVAPWHAERPGIDPGRATWRRAAATDFPKVAAWVTNQAELTLWTGPRYAFPDDLADLNAFFDVERNESWVLDEEGEPVAFGQIVARGIDRWHLVRIITHPERRRSGHAATLVGRLLQRARARGARVASLNVRPDNAAAARVYERLGFQPAERPAEDPPLVSTYYEVRF